MITILGILNQKFWNIRFLTPWVWNAGYFEGNTQYFKNLELRLNSRYLEGYYVPWLLLLVPNVGTVTKRRRAGLKNITINSNANYNVVISNYNLMIILIILTAWKVSKYGVFSGP